MGTIWRLKTLLMMIFFVPLAVLYVLLGGEVDTYAPSDREMFD